MRSRERGQLADMDLHDFDIMTEAKEEGLAEGARQKTVEAARNFKAAGVDVNIIAKCVGLSVEEVEQL